MRATGARAALVALAALLAGCAGAPPAADEPSPLQPVAPEPGAGGNATAPAPDGPPRRIDAFLYLAEGRTLTYDQPAAAGLVPYTENFLDPRPGLGLQPVTHPWTATGPVPSGSRIVSARFDLWFHSEQPLASPSPSIGFQPVILWFGQGGTWSPTFQYPAPATLQPGEVVHVEGEVRLPPGGYVFPDGAVPTVLLGLGYSQTEGSPLLIHVGGEEASRLTFVLELYEVPAMASMAEQAFEGSFAASHFVAPNVDPEGPTRAFPIDLGPGVAVLEVALEARSAGGALDLDLHLVGPGGEEVWASTTPHADEGLLLHQPNLAQAGTHTLVVRSFTAVQATFTLTARVHAAAEPADAGG